MSAFPKNKKRSLILISCLLLLAAAAALQPLSIQDLLGLGSRLANQPETILLLILLQIILYTLALPGTLVIWLVAPFNSLVVSVAAMLTGSVIGALGAYRISSQLSDDMRPKKAAWLFNMLRQRSDIYTQCALRILPGCPHWAINYGAGALKVPVLPFLVAAVIGLGIKWTLYCWLIQDITSVAQAENAMSIYSMLPLMALALLLLLGGAIRKAMILRSLRKNPEADDKP